MTRHTISMAGDRQPLDETHPIVKRLARQMYDIHKGERTPGLNVWLSFAWKAYAFLKFGPRHTNYEDVLEAITKMHDSPRFSVLPKYYAGFFKLDEMARISIDYCAVDHVKLYNAMGADERDLNYPNTTGDLS